MLIKFFSKKIFGLVDFYIKKKVSNYSNSKLETLLRAKVHIIEKSFIENDIDFLEMIYTKSLYFETRRRNLLSRGETDWCKRVLFGVTQKNNNISENIEKISLKDVIKQRRSIRKWDGLKIKEEEFKQLIEAARWAPSSCNKQPWHFLLTHDKDKILFLSRIKKQDFVKNAPSCILVLIDLEAYDEITKYYFAYLDAGVAVQNILLMAEDINLGACFVNFAPTKDFELQKNQIKQKFNIPLNLELIGIIPIGKTNKKLNPPGRKIISKIIHFETF